MRAFHSTGSRSTFAVIWAGDNSTASGPRLLFSSPSGANGRRIFRRSAASARDTAPIRIFSQSSSLLGSTSTTPFLVIVLPTALKMLSATGSIMYFISSLTDTTGLTSPHNAGGGGGGDEEHAANAAPATTSTAARVSRFVIRNSYSRFRLYVASAFRRTGGEVRLKPDTTYLIRNS